MGSVEARKRRASTLPIPVGLSGPTVKLTAMEDEFRVTAIGRVAHAHSQAVKTGVAPLTW
jgi:hypothetical protein